VTRRAVLAVLGARAFGLHRAADAGHAASVALDLTPH
jgi:hypothetical protein